jgi:hypothetical protein
MNSQNAHRPIFIICSPRSGSTLLRLIINSHSCIAIPPPTFLFNFIYPFLYAYGDMTKEENLKSLIEDALDLQRTCKPWPIKITVEQMLASINVPNFTGVYTTLHEMYATHYGKKRWGEKTPRNILFIKEILSCYPNAQFIHIIRDGRDVAVDWMENLDWPKNLYGTAKCWKDFVTAIKPWREKLRADQLLEIHYEDLVKDPIAVVQHICQFIVEDYEPEMLEYFKSDETLKWSKSASFHRFITKPITTEHVGIYKKKLKKEDRQILISVIGKELKALGYLIEDKPREIRDEELNVYLDEENITEVSTLVWKIEYSKKIEKRRQQGVWSG